MLTPAPCSMSNGTVAATIISRRRSGLIPGARRRADVSVMQFKLRSEYSLRQPKSRPRARRGPGTAGRRAKPAAGSKAARREARSPRAAGAGRIGRPASLRALSHPRGGSDTAGAEGLRRTGSVLRLLPHAGCVFCYADRVR
ncbi:hypothetical protein Ate02nite_91200 [Paractinoplanes tereljensis]|uniref:Uncharacterized protein n=1 Tax=Paractinoplanes tereljensis TaxID=571912 RepID=A0A919TZL5_9ACTN|nr:hypothetical protein Ate02nite_91200 [Actinoplanes tereljensis]